VKKVGYVVKGAVMALILAASVSFGADILVDDFTSAATSYQKGWRSVLPEDYATTTVEGGSLTISNTSNVGAEYVNTLSAPKPSQFTISFVLKSTTPSDRAAGLFFCRAASLNGYQITARNDTVIVYKYYGSGTSIYGSSIFYELSYDLKPTDNKLTVSKQGSTIRIFVNDVFQGQVTDNQFDAGDVAFFVPGNTTGVFGDFRMTDEFLEGGQPTSFSDNFNGNGLKYWKYLTYEDVDEPEISESNGELHVTTSATASMGMYVDHINLKDEFVARVEVRHKSGKSDSPYGIILIGQQNQMVSFAILGGKYAAAWSSSDISYIPGFNSAIHGAEGGKFGISDTLEVRRRAGSQTYEFTVNGTEIVPQYPVNFEITGVGIFSYDGMELAFDNFAAAQGGTVSVTWGGATSRIVRKPGAIRNSNAAVYDLKGRKRGTMTSVSGQAPVKRAAGVYVNENGREVIIRKKK
jgi:hypothetical protein